MSDHSFQQQVIEDLTELKTSMKSLIGNGQPGRIGLIEKKLSKHDWTLALIVGGILVLKFMFGA